MIPSNFTPEYLKRLEQFSIHSRRAFLGLKQGAHRSPRKGHGVEFSDYRMYTPGDNPRHIDWGVYARTEKLFIRRYQEEENLAVTLIIDGSLSLSAEPHRQKWEFARDIALSLAYIALMNHDAIRVAVHPFWISPRYDVAAAFHELGDMLLKQPRHNTEHKGQREKSFAQSLESIAGEIRFPGVAVVISDFLMPLREIESGMNALRARNVDLTAISVQSQADQQPLGTLEHARVRDAETGVELDLRMDAQALADYQADLRKHKSLLERYLRSSNIRTLHLQVEKGLERGACEALAKCGIVIG